MRFQAVAAARPEPITAIASDGETVTIPPIVSATAAPSSNGPRRLKNAARTIACEGRAARVGRQRRDCVRGVVEPIGHRKAQSEEDRNREPRVHSATLWR